jgi:hypothetical protein
VEGAVEDAVSESGTAAEAEAATPADEPGETAEDAGEQR